MSLRATWFILIPILLLDVIFSHFTCICGGVYITSSESASITCGGTEVYRFEITQSRES